MTVIADPPAATTAPSVPSSSSQQPPAHPDHGPVGCYLVYEPSSGGRLVLHYSKGPVPDNSVGFWCPGVGQKLQEFKFKQHGGRTELIKGIAGGDANRRKYYSGWCQFLKACKAKQGQIIQFSPPAGQYVPVDVYAMDEQERPLLLDLEQGLVDVSKCKAVAVMAKHHEFLKGVKTINMSNFLELGNLAGASTRM